MPAPGPRSIVKHYQKAADGRLAPTVDSLRRAAPPSPPAAAERPISDDDERSTVPSAKAPGIGTSGSVTGPMARPPPSTTTLPPGRHGSCSPCRMTVQRIRRRYGDDVRTLNLGQRVILVVALGAVCVAVDGFVAPRSSGWFGYAPNTGVVFDPDAGGKLKVLGVRLALTLAWTSSSFFLLRSPK